MRFGDWTIWAGAIILSLSLHLMLFVDRGTHAGVEKPLSKTTTRVSFRSVAAPVTPPEQDSPVKEPEAPEEEVVEAAEPTPKPVAKKKEQRAEKVRQREPAKPTPPAVTPPSPSAQSAEKPQLEETVGSVEDPALIEQAKQEYFRRLKQHIVSYRHYPRVAQRRGIEGSIEVNFNLLAAGEVADVTLGEGHRVLRKAAADALAAAQPLPSPPPSFSLPYAISFEMQFFLSDG